MQVSDEYSRGFNDARRMDRESVLDMIKTHAPYLNLEEWIDSYMPLEEKDQDEKDEENRWPYHVYPMLGSEAPSKVEAPVKKVYLVYINHGDGAGNRVDSLWHDIDTARCYADSKQAEVEDSAEVWVDEEDEYTVN